MFIKFCLLKQDKPADPIMTVFFASLSGKWVNGYNTPCFWYTTLERDGAIEKLTLRRSTWAVRIQGGQELHKRIVRVETATVGTFSLFEQRLWSNFTLVNFSEQNVGRKPKTVWWSWGSREIINVASYFRQNNQRKETWTIKTWLEARWGNRRHA